MLQNNSRPSESGNVFLFILLGVVLFAALAFTISRGFRSDTTSAMSDRQSELMAVDVISFAQRLERAVAKMQRSGISENDISFENETVAGYDHTPAAEEKSQVFHPTGGGITFLSAPSGANDGSPWHFTGNSCIPEVGEGDLGCGGNTASDEELLAILPNVKATICATIDKKLGIGDIPANSGGAYSINKYIGTFADGSEINIGDNHNAACYSDGGNYHFYIVLIAR
jgi:hypothetical protein